MFSLEKLAHITVEDAFTEVVDVERDSRVLVGAVGVGDVAA